MSVIIGALWFDPDLKNEEGVGYPHPLLFCSHKILGES